MSCRGLLEGFRVTSKAQKPHKIRWKSISRGQNPHKIRWKSTYKTQYPRKRWWKSSYRAQHPRKIRWKSIPRAQTHRKIRWKSTSKTPTKRIKTDFSPCHALKSQLHRLVRVSLGELFVAPRGENSFFCCSLSKSLG